MNRVVRQFAARPINDGRQDIRQIDERLGGQGFTLLAGRRGDKRRPQTGVVGRSFSAGKGHAVVAEVEHERVVGAPGFL